MVQCDESGLLNNDSVWRSLDFSTMVQASLYSNNGSSCSLDAGSGLAGVRTTTINETRQMWLYIIPSVHTLNKLRSFRWWESRKSIYLQRKNTSTLRKGKLCQTLEWEQRRILKDVFSLWIVWNVRSYGTHACAEYRKEFKRQIAAQAWIDITVRMSICLTGMKLKPVLDVGTGPCSYLWSMFINNNYSYEIITSIISSTRSLHNSAASDSRHYCKPGTIWYFLWALAFVKW
jgi:hypothetical protein